MRNIAAALLLLATACSSGSRGTGDILIGWAGPAELADGQASIRGAELAVREINAAGGVDGRQLRLILVNDSAQNQTGLRVARALKDSGVVAVIGHLYSGVTLAAAPVYGDPADPVALISPSSTAPAVSDAGEAIFRVCPSDNRYAAAIAQFVTGTLHADRAAVLYANNAYGRGFRTAFGEAFGGRVVAQDPYLDSDPLVRAYAHHLQRLDSADVVVLISGGEEEALQVLQQLRDAGWRGPIIGGDGLDGVQDHGALGEGIYLTTAWIAQLPGERIRNFLAAWHTAYPDAPEADQQAAAAYDIVHLLQRVIGEVGTDRRAIIADLARVGRDKPAFEGVLGTTAFDANGDITGRDGHVVVAHNGSLELATGR